MKDINFKYLRDNNYLLYEYVRGSKLYGIDRPGSDEDLGGVFIDLVPQKLNNITTSFPDFVSDEKNDTTWNSLSKYINLLSISNPNILESLYVPNNLIKYKNPIINELLGHRDKFLTKKCFGAFMGYSKTQLEKARSLKKKVGQPIKQVEPKVLDNIFTYYKQGSISFSRWLEERGLFQGYCGLVNVPNMPGNYSCFYDFGTHIREENKVTGAEEFEKFWIACITTSQDMHLFNYLVRDFEKYYHKNVSEISTGDLKKYWNEHLSIPKKYKGIVKEGDNESKQVRLSSVRKEDDPICYVSFNTDSFVVKCKKYADYQRWLKVRNEERFQEVVDGKSYDCKNLTHCARLINMGIEIAQGKGLIVDRRGIDADFLLQIRTGQVSYEEIMKFLESKEKIMIDAMNNSKLPDEVDKELLNKLAGNIYSSFYEISKK